MSASITIVGLGSGNPDRLTMGIVKTLQQATEVYIRTKDHPMMSVLDELKVSMQSFDHIYEARDSFPEVYASIADTLLEKASAGAQGSSIVYAVPGHPMVAECRSCVSAAQAKAWS